MQAKARMAASETGSSANAQRIEGEQELRVKPIPEMSDEELGSAIAIAKRESNWLAAQSLGDEAAERAAVAFSRKHRNPDRQRGNRLIRLMQRADAIA